MAPANRDTKPLSDPFIPHGLALDLSPEHLAEIPGGNVETYLNLRSMWRRRPDQPISSKAYAEAFRKGRNTVTKVLKLIAKHEGAEITEVRNKFGMHLGHLITVLPGEHGSNHDVAVNGHDVAISHPNSTQIATKSPLPVTAPCSPESSPCSPETTRASLVPHRASVGAPLDTSLDLDLDSSLEKELSRTADAATTTIDRSKSFQAVKAAYELYEQTQIKLHGPLSDQQSIDTVKQSMAGLSDDEAISAAATALHTAFSWHWIFARPASICAGQSIHAAMMGNLHEPTGGDTCTPDAGEPPTWDGSQWVDVICDQPFVSVVNEALLEAASPLDREKPSASPLNALQTHTEPSEGEAEVNTNPFPVKAVNQQPSVPQSPLQAATDRPVLKDETWLAEKAKRDIEALKAKLPAVIAAEAETSQHPTAIASSPDCGEDFFANFKMRQTA